VVVPATTEPGTYTLTVVQQAPTGRVFVAEIGLTVVAEAVPEEPAAETPAAAPTTQAVVNAGLRSNTGVVAPVAADDVTGSTGAVAAGAGLLLLAGAGGVVVRRRRAAAGTGEA
jgi:LPXTG-motif cell wall-anchored protein